MFCAIFLAKGGGGVGGRGVVAVEMDAQAQARARACRPPAPPPPSSPSLRSPVFVHLLYEQHKADLLFCVQLFSKQDEIREAARDDANSMRPFRDFEEEFDVFFRKRRTLMVEGVDGTSLFLRSVTPKQRGILSFISGNCALEGMVN